MRSAKSRPMSAFAPSATMASASRSAQPLFMARYRSAAGETARPPSGLARLFGFFGAADLGDDRFCGRCGWRRRRHLRRRVIAHGHRCTLAHGGATPRRLGLLLRRRCGFGRGRRGGRCGVDIGDCVAQFRFACARWRQSIVRAEAVLRCGRVVLVLLSDLLMARVRAIAVVLPIVTVAPSAAAAAASPPPIAVAMGVVAAMLLLGFHGLALPVGTVVGGKRLVVADSVAGRFARMLGGLVGCALVNRNPPAMLAAFAAVASAAAAPAATATMRAAVVLLVLLRRRGLRILGTFGFLGRLDRACVFEVVLLLQRCGEQRLALLGQRACGFRGMDLLTALDGEGLRRGYRLVGADGDGDGEALFESAQMGALLVKHVERYVGPRAGGEVMGGAAHQLLFERAQHLQRQRRHRADMARAAAIRALLRRALQDAGADALPRHFEQAEM